MQTTRKIQQNYKLQVRTSKKIYKSDKGIPVHLERYSFLLNSELHYLFFNCSTKELNYFLADDNNPFTDYSETDYETIFNNFAQVPIDRHETESALRRVFNKVRDYYNHDIETDRKPTQKEANQASLNTQDLDFPLTPIVQDINSYDFSKLSKKENTTPTNKQQDEDDLEFILNQEIAKASN